MVILVFDWFDLFFMGDVYIYGGIFDEVFFEFEKVVDFGVVYILRVLVDLWGYGFYIVFLVFNWMDVFVVFDVYGNVGYFWCLFF